MPENKPTHTETTPPPTHDLKALLERLKRKAALPGYLEVEKLESTDWKSEVAEADAELTDEERAILAAADSKRPLKPDCEGKPTRLGRILERPLRTCDPCEP